MPQTEPTELNHKISQLNSKVRNYKRQLTILENTIEKLANEDGTQQTHVDVSILDSKITLLNNYSQEYTNLVNELYASPEYPGLDPNEDLTTRFDEAIMRSKAIISTGNKNHTPSENQEPSVADIELERMKVPAFDGQYKNWISFYNSFSTLIHNNPRLNYCKRFFHLQNALIGDAADYMVNQKPSETAYKAIWEALIARYKNKRLLVQTHVKSLFEISPMSRENAADLRKMINAVTLNLSPIKELGQNLADDLLVYLISSKLDQRTRQQWEKSLNSNDMPKLDELLQFLNKNCCSLEASTIAVEQLMESRPNRIDIKKQKPRVHQTTNRWQGRTCPLCKGSRHYINKCTQFINLSPSERRKKLGELNLCTNCLSSNHALQTCTGRGCFLCNKMHHTLIHAEEISASPANANATSFAILPTCEVKVTNTRSESEVVRALLDSGSQINLMSTRLRQQLRLKAYRDNITIRGVGSGIQNSNSKVLLNVSAINGDYKSTIECYVVDRVTSNLPTQSLNLDETTIPTEYRQDLADKRFNKTGKIDLLLGADVFFETIKLNKTKLANGLRLQDTAWGWVISGKGSNHVELPGINLCCDSGLNKQMEAFWKLEEIHNQKPMLVDEKKCMELFQNSTRRNADGRFIVRLPWKSSPAVLGKSEALAKRRFLSLERRLLKDPELKEDYVHCIKDYIMQGHMEEVVRPITPQGCFLPHHAVIKGSSKTTKLRVVFDASAKTDNGVSLNDSLFVGPVLQPELFSLLVKFRLYKFVLTADIRQMYRQILIANDDTKYQRIFWRENPEQELKIFELKTVTFGTAPASFLATRSLSQIADDIEKVNPRLSKTIANCFYMDDLLTGANSVSELHVIKDDLSRIMNDYCFPIHKWSSNVDELKDKAVPAMLDFGPENEKILGICWQSSNDCFLYNTIDLRHKSLTKRSVLSQIGTIFDPLGLLSPVVISLKLLMQEIWKTNVSWDEELPDTVRRNWCKIIHDLRSMRTFTIPRFVLKENTSYELFVFSDASEKAYGAVIYTRAKVNDTFHVSLLCSKSRVAPLKTLSLPRLELCAAVLASDLYQKVVSAIDFEGKAYFFTDSSITLAWIKSTSNRWKTFVANRVSEIQTNTHYMSWYHVQSHDNPADLITRGKSGAELEGCTIWWQGPSWLQEHIDFTAFEVPQAEAPEAKVHVISFPTLDLGFIEKFTSYNKLLKVTAWVLRAIKLMQNKSKRKGPLTVKDIEEAEEKLLGLIQQKHFPQEFYALQGNGLSKQSPLLTLNPFLDAKNLIRVGGRLRKANVTNDVKHPLILPYKCHYTKLLIMEEHLRNLHCGCEATLAAVRQRFWPLGARRLIKTLLKRCVPCFKVNPKPTIPLMGDLPEVRVRAARPFLHSGVDYCGPFLIKGSLTRSTKSIKVYVAIFVCMSTKAVHLEAVAKMDTASFIAALRRFIARRGMVRKIFSDNGKNFVGAERELKGLMAQLLSQTSNEEIAKVLAKNRTEWCFNPPRAPHFGGLWEAAVKAFKYHLKRIKLPNLNLEDFTTLIVQIEAILNSRPISPISLDPNDWVALTPGHFLIGDALNAVPEPSLMEVAAGRMDKWQSIQAAREHFRRRWSTEYVQELQRRTKWKKGACPLRVGDLVIVRDDDVFPGRWPMGRIQEIYTASDGQVRSALVKMVHGVFKRPVVKLCPFPSDD